MLCKLVYINNIHLLRASAETKLPLVVSTGMASINEIAKAIEIIQDTGNKNYMLLHFSASEQNDTHKR